ncbi:hypothetical protein F4780DRAFT_545928 [Xylariomycetidae sp. FL0641]|nr:hypothetical protein F4780DRAFT_545928 [Xylariomycetidae sp. FL0641]
MALMVFKVGLPGEYNLRDTKTTLGSNAQQGKRRWSRLGSMNLEDRRPCRVLPSFIPTRGWNQPTRLCMASSCPRYQRTILVCPTAFLVRHSLPPEALKLRTTYSMCVSTCKHTVLYVRGRRLGSPLRVQAGQGYDKTALATIGAGRARKVTDASASGLPGSGKLINQINPRYGACVRGPADDDCDTRRGRLSLAKLRCQG